MSKKMKILLVDDEREFLESISERVRMKGFEPVLAQSGAEALEIAASEKIDAAVDLKMPGMDGLETIEALKKMIPGLHTVLLTGFGNEKVKMATEALDSGYFDKGEMDSFWDYLKSLGRKLERTMAAAGMAAGGDTDDAYAIEHENGKNAKKAGDKTPPPGGRTD
jgi:DNA-binding NtrC family response regulator